MSNIWITSDFHFGHNKDFIYAPRGFSSIWTHDETLIENFNSLVAHDDEVYILGDIMLNDNKHGIECLRRLHGNLHIMLGNHDTASRVELYNSLPAVCEVEYATVLKAYGHHFYLSHYPALVANHDENKPLKCLIFDSYYDNYLGTISMIRVFDGTVKAGDKITMMATGRSFEVVEVGIFNPGPIPTKQLTAGDVGYISASVKDVSECEVGDTITSATNPTKEPLPGYKKVLPMVYTGVYPADGARYNDLKEALLKLRLNDASLSFEPETSVALGFGFRCGFLGLLHMEVIEERLEREFNLDLITTTPSVKYNVTLTNGEKIIIENPTALPSPTEIDYIEEPVVRCSIYTPKEYIGSIMQLCQNKRGEYINLVYVDANRCELLYRMPLNEIVYDFFDKLKSRSRGYASLDYEMDGYQKSNLIRLDMLINGEQCDALSIIVHKDFAYARGRALAERLKEVIPRQMFEIPIQAAIGGKVIARETVKAFRKDVLAKCYGGDITRKKKLLEKQKEGKKRMRKVGSVEIPSEAFVQILKVDDNSD